MFTPLLGPGGFSDFNLSIHPNVDVFDVEMWFGCSEKAVIINHRKRSVLCQGIEVQGF